VLDLLILEKVHQDKSTRKTDEKPAEENPNDVK